MKLRRLSYVILTVQGIYYAITALWPLLHMESFLLVTGPKKDIWLVVTVSLLLLLIGFLLLIAIFKKQANLPIMFCSFFTALALGFIDIYYTSRGVISNIYLADAAVEIMILLYWFYYLLNADSLKKNCVQSKT